MLWRNAAALLAWLAWCAIPVFAAEGGVAPKNHLDSIVVTGRRISVVVTDADVKERVETAVRSIFLRRTYHHHGEGWRRYHAWDCLR